MDLSIRSKYMSKEVLKRRKQMIECEGLHIKDRLTKERIKNLYSKYGSGFNELEFVWAFLDIDELKYDKLEKGKTSEVIILSYEYVSDEEVQDIRNKLIENYDLKHGDKIHRDQIYEMYDKFGGRLSMKLFFEEVLGIKSELIKRFKKPADTRNGKLNFHIEPGQYNAFYGKKEELPMYVLNPDYIYEMRNKLLSEAGLRVGDSISYAQVTELNKKFCPDMPEVVFAGIIMDITQTCYNALKEFQSDNPINNFLFKNVDIPDEYIRRLKDKITIQYKLESGQLLKREEFQSIYDKYGGILSQKTFAVLVLEMSDRNYTNLMRSQQSESARILKSRKKTDFDILREKILKMNGLCHGDMLNYNQFKEIHSKYAPNISEFVFAEKVFGISGPSFQHMKYSGGRARILVSLPTDSEIRKLQQRVILENGIHINDRLNGWELDRLYELYGGVMPIKMFANKVLGIERSSFFRIKNNKDKEAFALFNLEISRSEIERIKQKIMLKHNLQKRRELTLEEINDLYTMYGGIMSFVMFSRVILGISEDTISNLKHGRCHSTMSCVRGEFNAEEVEKLKKYLTEGSSLYNVALRMDVTVTFLLINIDNLTRNNELIASDMLYGKVKLLKEQKKSPEEIAEELKLSPEVVKQMLVKYNAGKRRAARRKGGIKEKRNTDKEVENIKRRAIKAVDEYVFEEKPINNVRAYIAECRKSFEQGAFLKEDLDFLMECMIFIQCNCNEIELFSKICIYFGEYEMAKSFILENVDNEGILPEEKAKLMKLRANINYAIKQENAVRLIRRGELSLNEIAQKTGVLETDVIRLKKKMDEDKMGIIEMNKFPDRNEEFSE